MKSQQQVPLIHFFSANLTKSQQCRQIQQITLNFTIAGTIFYLNGTVMKQLKLGNNKQSIKLKNKMVNSGTLVRNNQLQQVNLIQITIQTFYRVSKIPDDSINPPKARKKKHVQTEEQKQQHKQRTKQLIAKKFNQIYTLLLDVLCKDRHYLRKLWQQEQKQKQKIIIRPIIDNINRVVKQQQKKQKQDNSKVNRSSSYQNNQPIQKKPTYQNIYHQSKSNNSYILHQPFPKPKSINTNGQTLNTNYNNQPKQQKPLQCQICLQIISTSDIGYLDSCKHKFHRQCITDYIKNSLNHGTIDIKCPMQNCKNKFSPNDIEMYIEGNDLIKFYNLTKNSYVQSNNSNTTFCFTPCCPAVIQYHPAITQYKCPVCKKHYCLKCKEQFHGKFSCQQNQKLKKEQHQANNKKSQDFKVESKFKQCPKCKSWVQKTMGCCTIKCRCGINFCYNCGGLDCPHGNCKQNLKPKK